METLTKTFTVKQRGQQTRKREREKVTSSLQSETVRFFLSYLFWSSSVETPFEQSLLCDQEN